MKYVKNKPKVSNKQINKRSVYLPRLSRIEAKKVYSCLCILVCI